MVALALARRRFSGWRVPGGTLVSQALQSGMLIYAFGLIILPFQAEFDASRQTLIPLRLAARGPAT